MQGFVASELASRPFVQAALADGIPIKVGPPPPPSGGLSGTLNLDEARGPELPLKKRSYLQPLSPTEALGRAKESTKDIVGVKALVRSDDGDQSAAGRRQ